MNIQVSQNAALNDALKALAEYRAASGIRPHGAPSTRVAHAGGAALSDAGAAAIGEPFEAALPRIGRHLNIWA